MIIVPSAPKAPQFFQLNTARMADTVSKSIRSRMMSGIRGRDTQPELLLRRLLHAKGLRFRVHAALPGKPDLVFPKYRVVVFVHGCFWHGHEGCSYFRLPSTRTDFWSGKISLNRVRDEVSVASLKALGWRVAVVWECALRKQPEAAATKVARFIMVKSRASIVVK